MWEDFVKSGGLVSKAITKGDVFSFTAPTVHARDITSDQYSVFMKDFEELDVDKSGWLEESEIHRLLQKQINTLLTDDAFAKFMKRTDKASLPLLALHGFTRAVLQNGDGKIDLHEYIRCVLGGEFTVNGEAPRSRTRTAKSIRPATDEVVTTHGNLCTNACAISVLHQGFGSAL